MARAVAAAIALALALPAAAAETRAATPAIVERQRLVSRPGGDGRLRQRRPHRREVERGDEDDRLRPAAEGRPLPGLHRRRRRRQRTARRLRRLARRSPPVPGRLASRRRPAGDAGRAERARAQLGRCDPRLRRLHRLLDRHAATAAAPGRSTPFPTATTTRSRMPRSRPTAASSPGPSASRRRASGTSTCSPAATSSRSPTSCSDPSRTSRTCATIQPGNVDQGGEIESIAADNRTIAFYSTYVSKNLFASRIYTMDIESGDDQRADDRELRAGADVHARRQEHRLHDRRRRRHLPVAAAGRRLVDHERRRQRQAPPHVHERARPSAVGEPVPARRLALVRQRHRRSSATS